MERQHRSHRRSWFWGVCLVVFGVAGWWSADLRSEESRAAEVSGVAPFQGSLLLDLDDDLDADERADIEERLGEAIAPHRWGAGLGDVLSRDAELYRLNVPESEVGDVLEALADDDAVQSIEVEGVWRVPEVESVAVSLAPTPADDAGAARGTFRPNDPYYKHQWHLEQVQMPSAWQSSRGRGTVVAVIDTGVAYADAPGFVQAPDLAETRFVAGFDFVDNDDQPFDEHGHGTHVAGTIAQSTNNGLGVAGVAPEASIMPIRVLDRRGAGRWGSVAAGIRWAADHGAHILNLSLGGPTPSAAIRNAMAYAHRKGVTIVVAAGNTGRGRVQYPAAHRHAIAVGAVRFDEQLSFYSSFGRHLDIVAPGGDLRVDQNGDGLPDGVLQNTLVRGNPSRHDYLAFQGTSMAAPHVAGVAALLHASGVRDPRAIEEILKRSAKAKGEARRYGAGLVQAQAALSDAHQSQSGRRAGLFFLMFAFLAVGARRKATEMVPAAIVGLLFSGAALWAMPGAWLAAMANFSLLWAVPVLPLAVILLGHQKASLRPTLAATALGAAAFALAEALFPTFNTAGLLGMLAGPALVLVAAFGAMLAWQTVRPER